jgi:predicted DNA-binding transcriptional regulator YafY
MPLASHGEAAGGAVWRRVQWLDHEIRAGRAPTRRQLRERFDIRESCATQTISFMREQLGLPLVHDPSRRGYVYRGDPPEIPAAHPGLLLSEAELTALRLAVSLAARYLDPLTTAHLEALSDRLLAAADPALAAEHARWGEDVVFTGPPPLSGGHLREVKRAIDRRRVLSLDYRAPGHDEEVSRDVEPHFLVNAGGDWLLVAWDRDRGAPRTFALARIQWCGALDERFERRPELQAEAFTAHQFLSEGGPAPYELVVRFATKAGRIAAERKWHPSQQTRTAEDGRLELTLTVSGTGDVLRWLLGFGGAVEVISPEWMRSLVHEESRAAAELNRPMAPGANP